MKKFLILIIVLLASGASEAQAQPFTPEAQTNYVEALAYWNQGEPSECTSLTKEVVTEVPAAHSAPGAVDYPSNGSPASWCAIEIESGLQPCLAKTTMYFLVRSLLGLSPEMSSPDLCQQQDEATQYRIEVKGAHRELRRVLRRCNLRRFRYCHDALAEIRAELHELSLRGIHYPR